MSERPEVEIRFAALSDEQRESGMKDASKDDRLACLAVCVLSQQEAGFGNYIDLREAECPECHEPGFLR